MNTHLGVGSFVVGALAATLVGTAVMGVGVAELAATGQRVAALADDDRPTERPEFVETMVVVGRRPGRPAAPALPRELTVSLALGADGSVSNVRAVSDSRDDESLAAHETWLAAQRFAPAAEQPFVHGRQ